jgi:hypothetical protein
MSVDALLTDSFYYVPFLFIQYDKKILWKLRACRFEPTQCKDNNSFKTQ